MVSSAQYEENVGNANNATRRRGSTDSIDNLDILPERQSAQDDLLSTSSQAWSQVHGKPHSQQRGSAHPKANLEEQFERIMERKRKHKLPQPASQAPGGRPPKASEASHASRPYLPSLQLQDMDERIQVKDEAIAVAEHPTQPQLYPENPIRDMVPPLDTDNSAAGTFERGLNADTMADTFRTTKQQT